MRFELRRTVSTAALLAAVTVVAGRGAAISIC
jgi:hypothetical protein